MSESKALKRLEILFEDFDFIDAPSDNSEVITAYGTVNGIKAYAFSQNSSVNSGAYCVKHCEKLVKLYELAEKTGCPIIGIYDSNGVSLNEGFAAVNAYGKVLKASSRLSGVVPQLSIIAGACLGSAAVIANMADVVVALKDSEYYITAPSDITADESAKQGAVDIVCDDFEEASAEAANIISLLPTNNLSPLPVFSSDELTMQRPHGNCVYEEIEDGIASVELKADYAKVKTVLTTVNYKTAGIIEYNSALTPADAYKAEAFIKLCNAYNIPIITVADTDGFSKENEAQMLISATRLISAYASATCPKISVITDKSIGGAYIALAGKSSNADLTIALENAVISPLEISSAVAFMFNERLAEGEDRAQLESEYAAEIASAEKAEGDGAVDCVIPREELRNKLAFALDMLAGKRETTIPRKHSVK